MERSAIVQNPSSILELFPYFNSELEIFNSA